MIKYGNSNYEKTINKRGDTIVSDAPITPEMEKNAAEGIKPPVSKKRKEEVININSRKSE